MQTTSGKVRWELSMSNIAVSGGLPATGKTYTERAGWVFPRSARRKEA